MEDKMVMDLADVGIEEGQKYEGIYTTMSKDGVKNAAPIGIVCKGKNKLGCRLFVGTKTLKNIMETRKYVVNITFYFIKRTYYAFIYNSFSIFKINCYSSIFFILTR